MRMSYLDWMQCDFLMTTDYAQWPSHSHRLGDIAVTSDGHLEITNNLDCHPGQCSNCIIDVKSVPWSLLRATETPNGLQTRLCFKNHSLNFEFQRGGGGGGKGFKASKPLCFSVPSVSRLCSWLFLWHWIIQIVAQCALKLFPCFFSADAFLTSDDNPDDDFLLDSFPCSLLIIWNIMFNVTGCWFASWPASVQFSSCSRNRTKVPSWSASFQVLTSSISRTGLSEDLSTHVPGVLEQFWTPSWAV